MACPDRVAIFWDYENCRPPVNLSGHSVADKIRRVAQSFGSIVLFKAYLQLSYEIPNPKTIAFYSELQCSGISLTHCPHNGKKDVADKMMLVDMMTYAIDKGAPATIVLISDDRDFAYGMSVLKLRKYNIVIVTSVTAHPSLKAQANVLSNWQDDVLRLCDHDLVAAVPDFRNRSRSFSVQNDTQSRTTEFSRIPTSLSTLPVTRWRSGSTPYTCTLQWPKAVASTSTLSSSHTDKQEENIPCQDSRSSLKLAKSPVTFFVDPQQPLTRASLDVIQLTAPVTYPGTSRQQSYDSTVDAEPSPGSYSDQLCNRVPGYSRIASFSAAAACDSTIKNVTGITTDSTAITQHDNGHPPTPPSVLMSPLPTPVPLPTPSTCGGESTKQAHVGDNGSHQSDIGKDCICQGRQSPQEDIVPPEGINSEHMLTEVPAPTRYCQSEDYDTNSSQEIWYDSWDANDDDEGTGAFIDTPHDRAALVSPFSPTSPMDEVIQTPCYVTADPQALRAASTTDLNKTPPAVDVLSVQPTVTHSYPVTSIQVRPYDALVTTLKVFHSYGITRPRWSQVGADVLKRDAQVYQRAGASRLKQYLELAQSAHIVTIGGLDSPGREWIELNPKYIMAP